MRFTTRVRTCDLNKKNVHIEWEFYFCLPINIKKKNKTVRRIEHANQLFIAHQHLFFLLYLLLYFEWNYKFIEFSTTMCEEIPQQINQPRMSVRAASNVRLFCLANIHFRWSSITIHHLALLHLIFESFMKYYVRIRRRMIQMLCRLHNRSTEFVYVYVRTMNSRTTARLQSHNFVVLLTANTTAVSVFVLLV